MLVMRICFICCATIDELITDYLLFRYFSGVRALIWIHTVNSVNWTPRTDSPILTDTLDIDGWWGPLSRVVPGRETLVDVCGAVLFESTHTTENVDLTSDHVADRLSDDRIRNVEVATRRHCAHIRYTSQTDRQTDSRLKQDVNKTSTTSVVCALGEYLGYVCLATTAYTWHYSTTHFKS